MSNCVNSKKTERYNHGYNGRRFFVVVFFRVSRRARSGGCRLPVPRGGARAAVPRPACAAWRERYAAPPLGGAPPAAPPPPPPPSASGSASASASSLCLSLRAHSPISGRRSAARDSVSEARRTFPSACAASAAREGVRSLCHTWCTGSAVHRGCTVGECTMCEVCPAPPGTSRGRGGTRRRKAPSSI